jgi:hypothetical protein
MIYTTNQFNIQIFPTGQHKSPTVVLTNEGRIPAANLFLMLITPQPMVDYPNYPQTFSTLNV